MNFEQITTKLIRLTSEFTPTTEDSIELDQELYRDLKIDGDEFSFYFAPLIEKEFGLAIPSKDWSKLTTVRDLALYMQRRGAC